MLCWMNDLVIILVSLLWKKSNAVFYGQEVKATYVQILQFYLLYSFYVFNCGLNLNWVLTLFLFVPTWKWTISILSVPQSQN